ncbi:MAG: radical SAM/SPASM domain-containing protein [Candidatus Kapaibacterium sp.]
MIDYNKLNETYTNDGIYALQLEIGDICYQGCSYCYMNAVPEEINKLSDDKIREILFDSTDLGITAIEWLGGEPLIRPSVFEHMELARNLGLRNNMWTGGLPFADPAILRRTAVLADPGLISVHCSTVNPDIYKLLHPANPVEDMHTIINSVRNLLGLGYPAENILNSVTFTGLQPASDMIETIDFFEREFGVMTSINVYHTYLRPGQSDSDLARFIPSEGDVARVHKRWKLQTGAREMPMNCVNKQYCSATAAVLSNGSVTGCATIREPGAPNVNRDGRLSEIVDRHRDHLIFKYFKNEENLPEDCRQCSIASECWGCRSRAYAAGLGLYSKDPRCFKYNLK